MRRSSVLGAVAASTIAVLLISATTTGAAPPNPVPESGAVGPAQRLGLQQVPKDVGAAANAGSALSSTAKGANPLIALLPDPSRADYAYWKAVLAKAGKACAAQKAQVDAATFNRVSSLRPCSSTSRNPINSRWERHRRHRPVHPAVRQRRRQAPRGADPRDACGDHAADSVRTGARRQRFDPARRCHSLLHRRERVDHDGRIGDGPHGSAGDASGDFDFYKLSAAKSGQTFVVDINTVSPSVLDSVVAVWDATGNLLALNDDDGLSLDSRLLFTIPRNGDYFVSVAGFPIGFRGIRSIPAAGRVPAVEGAYPVIFGLDADDHDLYGVDLRAGDVIGASVTGAAGTSRCSVPSAPSGRLPTGPDRHLSGIDTPARRRQRGAGACRRRGRPLHRRGHRRHRQLRHHPRGLPPRSGVDGQQRSRRSSSTSTARA